MCVVGGGVGCVCGVSGWGRGGVEGGGCCCYLDSGGEPIAHHSDERARGLDEVGLQQGGVRPQSQLTRGEGGGEGVRGEEERRGGIEMHIRWLVVVRCVHTVNGLVSIG